MDTLIDWIKKHEGLRLFPYRCTSGKLTIGYGRNLDDKGISTEEAKAMLDTDIKQCAKELSHFQWYIDQPINVRYALINMCFNIGLPKLLRFKRMIAAIEKKDYDEAADEALDSLWAKQVGQRADDVANMIRQRE